MLFSSRTLTKKHVQLILYLFAAIQRPPTYHIHGLASCWYPAVAETCQYGDQAGLNPQPTTEGESLWGFSGLCSSHQAKCMCFILHYYQMLPKAFAINLQAAVSVVGKCQERAQKTWVCIRTSGFNPGVTLPWFRDLVHTWDCSAHFLRCFSCLGLAKQNPAE